MALLIVVIVCFMIQLGIGCFFLVIVCFFFGGYFVAGSFFAVQALLFRWASFGSLSSRFRWTSVVAVQA